MRTWSQKKVSRTYWSRGKSRKSRRWGWPSPVLLSIRRYPREATFKIRHLSCTGTVVGGGSSCLRRHWHTLMRITIRRLLKQRERWASIKSLQPLSKGDCPRLTRLKPLWQQEQEQCQTSRSRKFACWGGTGSPNRWRNWTSARISTRPWRLSLAGTCKGSSRCVVTSRKRRQSHSLRNFWIREAIDSLSEMPPVCQSWRRVNAMRAI